MSQIEGATGAESNPVAVMPEGMALTDRVRLNTWVKRNIWEGVSDISRAEDMSVSDVVRDALKDYIRKYKSRAKGK